MRHNVHMQTGFPDAPEMPRVRLRRTGLMSALLAVTTGTVAVGYWWSRRRPGRAPEPPPRGLSQVEADAAYASGEAKASQRSLVRSAGRIRRESVFTVFHVNLIGLALVQLLLLHERLSGILTLVMLGVSIAIRWLQEKLAVRRLAKVLDLAALRFTVVRDGQTRDVPPEQVVPGDLLLVGPGDQILADGVYHGPAAALIDSYPADGIRGPRRLRPGRRVLAGSFCVAGDGSYLAEKLGPDTRMSKRAARGLRESQQSPLEQVMSKILQALLVVVIVYAGLYLAELSRLDIGAPLEAFVDAAPVVFDLVPSGLYLMIIISYIAGAADLAQHGGVVTRARSIEALAETTVICFTEESIFTALSEIGEFTDAGVQVKVFVADAAPDYLDRLVERGITSRDAEYVRSRGMISRDDLRRQARSGWGRIARENALFGGLSPAEVAEMVRELRVGGDHVTVVGDGVADLAAMAEADVAVAQPGATQAALAMADIYLRENSPRALLAMLRRGQTIVQGLLNVIKLDLTLVLATAALIIMVRLFSSGFPHAASHDTALGIIAVTIPSLALAAWSGAGPVSTQGYGKVIARFVLPAGLGLSLVSLVVYHYFLSSSGRMIYAQQAVAYVLIYAGLIVALMTLHSAKMVALVTVLMAIATVQPQISLARWFFGLDWLSDPVHYLIVGLAVLVWAAGVLVLWRLLGFTERLRHRGGRRVQLRPSGERAAG